MENVNVTPASKDRSLRLIVGAAALCVPLLTAADSMLETRSDAATLRAQARVDFKIIIPSVLSLDLTHDARRAELFSTNRSVSLGVSDRASAASRGATLIIAGRRIIAQTTTCVPSTAAASALLVCTASMP
jgi:hypothetical protein